MTGRPDERPLSPAMCRIFLGPDGGPRRGYDILQQVERDSSSGAAALGAGALSGVVDGMVQAGTVLGGDVGDERRVYFELTTETIAVLPDEPQRLERAVRCLALCVLRRGIAHPLGTLRPCAVG